MTDQQTERTTHDGTQFIWVSHGIMAMFLIAMTAGIFGVIPMEWLVLSPLAVLVAMWMYHEGQARALHE